MTRCTDIRPDLDPYRDGALEPARAGEVRRHLAACAECAAAAAAAAAVEADLRALAGTWQPPPGLLARVRASVDARAREPASRRAGARLPRALAVGLALAATALAAGMFLGPARHDAGPEPVATALVNEFRTFVISRRDLDFPSRSPLSVRGWFSDKVDFRPPTPAAAPGLRLAGGRLCNILDQRVVSYMYESDGAWVSLYIMGRPPAGPPGNGDGEVATVGGYGYAGWSSGGLWYSLVGDVPGHRLEHIAEALRAARESTAPGRDGTATGESA